MTTPNPYAKIAGVIADMLKQPDATPPMVNGRSMYVASACELVDAIRNEAITLGMHKAQYPFNDSRVADQAARVNALVQHLRDRLECA
jgi:hypothetical protein